MGQYAKARILHIFISYSRKDKGKVLPVVDELKQIGYEVWIDVGDKGVAPGQDLPYEIEEAILDCDVFLAYLSANYYKSKWCGKELAYADNNDKRIIPVKLDETKPTQGLGLLLSRRVSLEYLDTSSLINALQKSADFQKLNSRQSSPNKTTKITKKEMNMIGYSFGYGFLAGVILTAILALFVFAVSSMPATSWEFDDESGILKIGLTPGNTVTTENYSYIKDDSFLASPWVKKTYQIKVVVIGDYVTAIGSNAFENCENLEYIQISNNVTSIGPNSFSGCFSLENIEIPSGVSRVFEKAFSNCINLKKITIRRSSDVVQFVNSRDEMPEEPINHSGDTELHSPIVSIQDRSLNTDVVPSGKSIKEDDGILYIVSNAFPPDVEIIYSP